jgi:hypothetical protein
MTSNEKIGFSYFALRRGLEDKEQTKSNFNLLKLTQSFLESKDVFMYLKLVSPKDVEDAARKLKVFDLLKTYSPTAVVDLRINLIKSLP